MCVCAFYRLRTLPVAVGVVARQDLEFVSPSLKIKLHTHNYNSIRQKKNKKKKP